ncbi:MAG: hypothetical protein AAFR45_09020 [Pseudomonadota bacterium]
MTQEIDLGCLVNPDCVPDEPPKGGPVFPDGLPMPDVKLPDLLNPGLIVAPPGQ